MPKKQSTKEIWEQGNHLLKAGHVESLWCSCHLKQSKATKRHLQGQKLQAIQEDLPAQQSA